MAGNRAQVSNRPVSNSEFTTLVAPLVGKKISHVWRGFGSAIFLEIGELREIPPPKSSRKQEPTLEGEYTIMIEWSWRVEKLRSIEFGSWSSVRLMTNRLPTLVGHSILGIHLIGRLPEIQIDLTRNRWVNSLQTAEGQPDWTIFIGGQWLRVRNGRVVLEHSTQDKSP